MEALRDISGFFLALALALLLDSPTGPQVRTSVRDKPKYKSKDESKGVDFKNYKGAQKATRTGWEALQHTQNCARDMRGATEKAGSAARVGREVACAVMPVPQEQGAGRVNGGRAQRGKPASREAHRTERDGAIMAGIQPWLGYSLNWAAMIHLFASINIISARPSGVVLADGWLESWIYVLRLVQRWRRWRQRGSGPEEWADGVLRGHALENLEAGVQRWEGVVTSVGTLADNYEPPEMMQLQLDCSSLQGRSHRHRRAVLFGKSELAALRVGRSVRAQEARRPNCVGKLKGEYAEGWGYESYESTSSSAVTLNNSAFEQLGQAEHVLTAGIYGLELGFS
ncbi:hypothetical protein C8J57DRAFT_1230780 [Mycena rebaudengoi]|nr:hypothetical protein C8J57DRAFT_1230780 [Mycena rebaudengoi]